MHLLKSINLEIGEVKIGFPNRDELVHEDRFKDVMF